jgi:hypothetical protein
MTTTTIKEETEALTATLRKELDAWYGRLNQVDRQLAKSKLPKTHPLTIEGFSLRQGALDRIHKIEEMLGQR